MQTGRENLNLHDVAAEVRANAYSPYSGYQVGCAILGADGKVYVGANFENISFGATICAERCAIGAMIAAGCTKIAEIAVVTADGAAPCGICRQAIAEFATADVPVHCYDDQGKCETFTFGTLLPKSFESTEVRPRPDSSKR